MAVERKQYTVDEWERFLALPENADRRFELIQGEIVEKRPTQVHAAIVSLLTFFLMAYLRENPIGWVLVEARYQLPDDRINARIPDLSFVSDRSRPLVSKGPAPYMPDLAVEIQSPDDSLKRMSDKATYYLPHGSHMVWLVYPDQQLVEVLTTDDRQLLTGDDQLTGGSLLAGFSVPVREIFPKIEVS